MWLLSLILIACGAVSFFMGLSHDGIEAPMPTATGGALSWGGLALGCIGVMLLLWKIGALIWWLI